MDGVDTLRKRIQDETDLTVESLLSSARQERDSVLAGARQEADRIREENEARESRLAKERDIQKQAISRLEDRRRQLRVKQEILQETLTEVVHTLENLPAEERRKLYSAWLKNAGADRQTITFAEADQAWAGAFIAEHYPELTVDPEAGQFSGGFILREERSWQDYRFESVIKQNENQWLSQAAEILFPEGD